MDTTALEPPDPIVKRLLVSLKFSHDPSDPLGEIGLTNIEDQIERLAQLPQDRLFGQLTGKSQMYTFCCHRRLERSSSQIQIPLELVGQMLRGSAGEYQA